MPKFKLGKTVNIQGKSFTISKSDRKNKQRKACNDDIGCIHYGDPSMPEFPGTKRGDNYCTRSLGIAKKFDIKGDPSSPNFWSRLDLWNCQGKKSKKIN